MMLVDMRVPYLIFAWEEILIVVQAIYHGSEDYFTIHRQDGSEYVVQPSDLQGSRRLTAAIKKMVGAAGGSFTMGDSHDTVTVRPFCMDVTEVTVDADSIPGSTSRPRITVTKTTALSLPTSTPSTSPG